LIRSEIVLGLPDYEITELQISGGGVRISARHTGLKSCPHCGSDRLRNKGRYQRRVRHENWGLRHCVLELEARKFQCQSCGRYFRERFPGIQPCQRAREALQKMIFRSGYATTLCDLRNHKIYAVVLGRSELSLQAYFQRLEGKAEVRVVGMDLASNYRSLVRLHFPNARIVTDRFHGIRLINHHFLACWRDIDGAGAKNRGLLSLMRRHRHNLRADQQLRLAAYLSEHPVLETIYHFQQRLCYLLLKKHRSRKQCEQLVPPLLRAVYQLRQAGLARLVQLGHTLSAWSEEIVSMWRFTRNNGITEGFHNKMELINRQAYGFRNFQNYRLPVKVLCS